MSANLNDPPTPRTSQIPRHGTRFGTFEGGDGRFAPSPTGALHIGNLRTALLAWLFARSAGARYLIRIEDLDEGRVRERFVAEQLDDLAALGLDWDEEPLRQSARTPLYAEALSRFEADGLTYRCFCSRREIREAASAQHGEASRYPGTCAALSEAEAGRRARAGDQFCLRLRAGGVRAGATDRLHGPVEAEVDDVVLVRRDGAFAYNLAVVVDDAAQGIGEVVRGDDLLSSTPVQAHLCDLLGLPRPAWAHVPLILGADGERLAKRHGAVTLSDLRERGLEPAAVLSKLGTSLGLAVDGERVGAADLVDRFEPGLVPREPAVWRDQTCDLSAK